MQRKIVFILAMGMVCGGKSVAADHHLGAVQDTHQLAISPAAAESGSRAAGKMPAISGAVDKESEQERSKVEQRALFRGTMRQSELDEVAQALNAVGARRYLIWAPEFKEAREADEVRGLVLMRDPKHLLALPEGGYTDLRGNLVFFGSLGEKATAADHSLTLFSGGGIQLAVDLDLDGIVDVAVSRGLQDRFGFLASPDAQRMLECLQRARESGGNPMAAVPGCLGDGEEGDGDGDGGAVGGGAAGRLDSLTDPDCESGQPGAGFAGRIAADGDKRPEEKFRDEAKEHRAAAERHRREARAADKGIGRYRDASAEERNAAENRHRNLARRHERLAEEAERVADSYAILREAANDPDESEETVRTAAEIAARAGANFRERERDLDVADPWMQPEIVGPNRLPQGSFDDPRCREPSVHQRLLTEECSTNTIECLKRVNDSLYGATGGTCQTFIGPNDRPMVQCEQNKGFRQCVREGGSARECAQEQRAQRNDCTADRPCVGDDLRPGPSGGVPGKAAIDATPLGGVIPAMCREGAMIPPCAMPSGEL